MPKKAARPAAKKMTTQTAREIRAMAADDEVLEEMKELMPELYDRVSQLRSAQKYHIKTQKQLDDTATDAELADSLAFLAHFKPSSGRLNSRQILFVAHCLSTPSAAEAAKRAGYKESRGYRYREIARDVMQRSQAVREAFAEAVRRRLKRLSITQDEALLEIRNQAYFDPIDVLEPDGNGRFVVKDLTEIPADARRCIKKMQRTILPNGQENIVVEFYDKMKMLELLGRHTGVLDSGRTQVDVNVNVSRSEMLERARARQQGQTLEAKPSSAGRFEVESLDE